MKHTHTWLKRHGFTNGLWRLAERDTARQNKAYQCEGYSPNNILRVIGRADNPRDAEANAIREAKTFIEQRPETGPLAKWTFKTENRKTNR